MNQSTGEALLFALLMLHFLLLMIESLLWGCYPKRIVIRKMAFESQKKHGMKMQKQTATKHNSHVIPVGTAVQMGIPTVDRGTLILLLALGDTLT